MREQVTIIKCDNCGEVMKDDHWIRLEGCYSKTGNFVAGERINPQIRILSPNSALTLDSKDFCCSKCAVDFFSKMIMELSF